MNYSMLTRRGIIYTLIIFGMNYLQPMLFAQISLSDIAVQSEDASDDIDLEMTFEVEKGLYIQSDTPKNPYLIPTSIMFEEAEGIEIVDLVFVRQHDTDDFQDDSIGEDILTGKFTIQVTGKKTGGNISLGGQLKFQACSKLQCFFPRTVAFGFGIPEPMIATSESIQD